MQLTAVLTQAEEGGFIALNPAFRPVAQTMNAHIAPHPIEVALFRPYAVVFEP